MQSSNPSPQDQHLPSAIAPQPPGYSSGLTALANRRVVIFDLFHTLATARAFGTDTSELLRVERDVYLRALFGDAHDRVTGVLREPVDIVADIAQRCGSPVDPSEYPGIAAARSDRFTRALREISPAVVAALDRLLGAGRTLALISNADALEIAGWPQSPLSSRMPVAIFSCDVGVAKPDPEIYRICLARLGVSADEALFVGDGGSDEFSGARAVGLPTVCTTEFIASWPAQRGAATEADYRVDSLHSLADALLGKADVPAT